MSVREPNLFSLVDCVHFTWIEYIIINKCKYNLCKIECEFYRPIHALTFAAVSGSIGLVTLYYGVNPITAVLGATNLILYTSVYTPMKRISILNTWVGSVGN